VKSKQGEEERTCSTRKRREGQEGRELLREEEEET
jgi:hypothetical protein